MIHERRFSKPFRICSRNGGGFRYKTRISQAVLKVDILWIINADAFETLNFHKGKLGNRTVCKLLRITAKTKRRIYSLQEIKQTTAEKYLYISKMLGINLSPNNQLISHKIFIVFSQSLNFLFGKSIIQLLLLMGFYSIISESVMAETIKTL